MALSGTAHIQYATSPAGPWYTIGNAHPQGSTCPPDGTAFTGTAQARNSWAYYRVSFGGEYGFLPSVSSPVPAWKYLDRITGYHAARHGTHVTVSGPPRVLLLLLRLAPLRKGRVASHPPVEGQALTGQPGRSRIGQSPAQERSQRHVSPAARALAAPSFRASL
jgi:hypothetical protein